MRKRGRQGKAAAERYVVGMTCYRAGRYARALDELTPLSDRDDLIGRMSRLYCGLSEKALGLAAIREGRYAEAQQHLTRAMRRIGKRADLLEHLAGLHARTGRHDSCAATMEMVAETSSDPSARVKLALTQWGAGRRTEAVMTLTTAARTEPGNAAVHVQLGLFHAAQEHFVEAVEALERAVRIDCEDARAHRHLAMTLAAMGDARGAAVSFQRALELRPDDILTAYHLALSARAAAEAGHPVALRVPELQSHASVEDALPLVRYVCDEPDFVRALLSLPESPIDDELFGMLLAVVERALDEHPEYADLNLICAQVLARLGRTDRAIDRAKKAIFVNPHYTQALVELGRLCARAGRCEEALVYLRRAIACGGDFADVHCLAGELLAQSGQHARARRHLRRALELNANYHKPSEVLAAIAA